jgi:transcription initiation factor TFIIH subunit 4
MENAVNILSYVESLNENVRDMLYESPWTCQAVFRSLQPLAKQYVLRMLWILDKSVVKSELLQL